MDDGGVTSQRLLLIIVMKLNVYKMILSLIYHCHLCHLTVECVNKNIWAFTNPRLSFSIFPQKRLFSVYRKSSLHHDNDAYCTPTYTRGEAGEKWIVRWESKKRQNSRASNCNCAGNEKCCLRFSLYVSPPSRTFLSNLLLFIITFVILFE